jgi:hypothetical protein
MQRKGFSLRWNPPGAQEYKGNAMCDFSVFDTIPPGQPCIHIQLSLSGTSYDKDLKKGSSVSL